MKLKVEFLLGLSALLHLAQSRDYHDVFWNSRYFPKRFKHAPMKVHINDQLTIVCPKAYHPGMSYEYSKLYWVNKDEWVHCYLGNPVWVGVCANENDTTTIKTIFRRLSPVPGGKDFQEGRTYYLISTSSGEKDGMNQKSDGLCLEHQMKIAIKIVGNELSKMEYEIHDSQSLASTASTSKPHIKGFIIIIAAFTIFFVF